MLQLINGDMLKEMFLSTTLFLGVGFVVSGQQSIQLFIEDFNTGGGSFLLNSGGSGSNTGENKWIVNGEFDGQGVYPNTTRQDSVLAGTINAVRIMPFTRGHGINYRFHLDKGIVVYFLLGSL